MFDNRQRRPRKKPTKGFSELNKRTYEASQHRRSENNDFAAGFNPQQAVKPAHIPTGGKTANDYSRNTTARRYSQAHKKNKNKKRTKIIIGIVVGVIALLIAGGIAFASMIANNMHEGMDNIGLTPTSLNQPFYTLLMGVDASDERKGEGGTDNDFRSDSIILTRVDPIDKKVTMMSLHRDVEIDMGEHGKQKLNAAHSLGGPELCIKCAEQLCGVKINHYAEANFEGFAQAVDDLGGVEVDVPIDINDVEAGGSVPKGRRNLNGQEALIVCRTRHSFDDVGDGDKYRAANQRMVLTAIAKKALESDIATIAKTVTDLSKYIKTSIPLNDIIGLAQNMKDIDIEKNVYSAMMPTTGVLKDGVWYEEIDEPKFKAMMKRMDEGKPPSLETIVDTTTGVVLAYAGSGDVKVAVKNGTNTEGLAARAAEKIGELGMAPITGNADNANYNKTLIIVMKGDNQEAANKIKETLGVGEIKNNNSNEYSSDADILVILGADYH